VLPAAEVYTGAQIEWAPDLELGFNLGYGASDPSAEGQVTGEPVIVATTLAGPAPISWIPTS